MGHDAILQVRADREITVDETRSVSNIIGKYYSGADDEFLDVKRFSQDQNVVSNLYS